jgi:hypothetical protein
VKAHTKEEKFIIALHDAALAKGDIEEPINRYHLSDIVGLHAKGIDTICNRMAQANFIKKEGDVMIRLTSNGLRLYENLDL